MAQVKLEQAQTGVDARVTKLKIPIFKWEGECGWIYRAQKYFCGKQANREGEVDVDRVMLGGEGTHMVSMGWVTTTNVFLSKV